MLVVAMTIIRQLFLIEVKQSCIWAQIRLALELLLFSMLSAFSSIIIHTTVKYQFNKFENVFILKLYYSLLLSCSNNNCTLLNKPRITDSVEPGSAFTKSVDIMSKSMHFNDAETWVTNLVFPLPDGPINNI